MGRAWWWWGREGSWGGGGCRKECYLLDVKFQYYSQQNLGFDTIIPKIYTFTPLYTVGGISYDSLATCMMVIHANKNKITKKFKIQRTKFKLENWNICFVYSLNLMISLILFIKIYKPPSLCLRIYYMFKTPVLRFFIHPDI